MANRRWQMYVLILLTLVASVGSVWCATACLPHQVATKHCPNHPAPKAQVKACADLVWELPQVLATEPPVAHATVLPIAWHSLAVAQLPTPKANGPLRVPLRI